MVGLMAGVAVMAVVAGLVYLGRERLGPAGVGMAALRTVGVGALLVLLANPSALRRGEGGTPTVLLDASLSMAAAGGQWARALDTARVLAGPDGLILRFGDGVAPFDSAPPADGTTRLEPALRAAVGRGGPVWVVTDGELQDGLGLAPALRRDAGVVLLPRDTVPDAALLDATIHDRILEADSLRVVVEIGTWGALADTAGVIEVSTAGRTLTRTPVRLPRAPGVARREFHLAPGLLAAGTHVVTLRLVVAGDGEPADDERVRVVTVAAQPGVVALVAPSDWEGRFLVRELAAVTSAAVQGFARLAPDRWVDMRTLEAVTAAAVRQAVASAELVVERGTTGIAVPARTPVWRWPAGGDGARVLDGDWYAASGIPPSPLGGALGTVEWDSLPPLSGLIPVTPTDTEWVGLEARLGRRGAERPVVLGRDSAGVRQVVTTGTGLWRWALRGGAAWEGYRTVVAAGIDWLLESGTRAGRPRLTAAAVVPRGAPLVFRWSGAPPEGAVAVSLRGPDSTRTDTLRFSTDGRAAVRLNPGVWRWRAAAGAAGVSVVEPYSPETPPGSVTLAPAPGGTGLAVFLLGARDRWWLFALVVAALAGEWAWRIRRGLP